MKKNRMVKPIILLLTIMILGLIMYIFTLNMRLDYKQRILNDTCLSILHDVQFAYNYDGLDESEIRALQAVDINNLLNAQSLIYHTSWPAKDKINEMVVSLTSYYNNLYVEGKYIEASKASSIYDNYMGVLINIDNEYSEVEIDNILEFLKYETK
jgi:hypothetical protein